MGVHKVRYPVAVYRNGIKIMERFIGTDTARVEIFFNKFTSGFETFVIQWD